jgi:hypothetical protein
VNYHVLTFDITCLYFPFSEHRRFQGFSVRSARYDSIRENLGSELNLVDSLHVILEHEEPPRIQRRMTGILSNQERLEQERRDQDRREQERQEEERRELERREQGRLEQERHEQERLEEERRELRRIEETLEREDLQERLAQALQAQQNLEQEKRRQQQHEKQEQERKEEERRRQGTREQGRREQEALVQGRALVQGGAFAQGEALVERRALNDSEWARKRHTQIDMESLDAIRNQRGLVIVGQAQERQHYTGQEIPGSNLQSGRELVLADPSNLQAPVNNRLEQEGLEGLERARLERMEQERLEQERILEAERTRKRHTQIDMESLVSGRATRSQDDLSLAGHAQVRQQTPINDRNIGQETTGSNLQPGRELVVANPSSNIRNLQTPVNDETSGRQVIYRPPPSISALLTSTGFDSTGSGDTAFYPHHLQCSRTRGLEDLPHS